MALSRSVQGKKGTEHRGGPARVNVCMAARSAHVLGCRTYPCATEVPKTTFNAVRDHDLLLTCCAFVGPGLCPLSTFGPGVLVEKNGLEEVRSGCCLMDSIS